jgi:prephenate dehydrogenase
MVGAIDAFTESLREGVSQADCVIFCTPVDRIPEQLVEAGAYARPGTILTDAGSTKAHIVEAGQRLPKEVHFIGGHPLAGSEKRGPEHAREDLFVNRVTVLTPTEQTPPDVTSRVSQFWQTLGSRVRIVDPVTHDQILATTSHLPHLVAFALAGMLSQEWFDFTATGFRDTTRLAGSDPELWTAIFQANREGMRQTLDFFINSLQRLGQMIAENDTAQITAFLTHCKQVRDALGS